MTYQTAPLGALELGVGAGLGSEEVEKGSLVQKGPCPGHTGLDPAVPSPTN